MFTLYASQTLILSLGLICLIVFSGILFCENYKDMIVNKLIEGHTIYECIWKHLVIKLIIYILSGIFTIVLEKLMIVSMNYYIIAGSLAFDIIFTITICKRIAKRKVYDLVKGAE